MKQKLIAFIEACGLKQVFILSSGVVIAQVIGILAQTVATRLYDPDQFGLLNLLVSLVSMFTPLVTMQYEYSIITEKTDKNANSVTAVCFLFCSIGTFVFAVGVTIYNIIVPETFAELGGWLSVSVVMIFFSGIASIATSYNNRFGQYGIISKVSVYRAAVSGAVKLAYGAVKPSFVGLVLSNIISTAFGMRKQTKYMRQKENMTQIARVSREDLKGAFLRNINQMLYSTPGLFIIGYSSSVIPFYIKSLYGLTENGFYAITVSTISLPLTLISANVGKVFFKNAAQEYNTTGSFFKSVKSTVLMLSVISAAGFTLLYFIAVPLFSLVYGSEWARSGQFAVYIVPLYAIKFVSHAVNGGLIIRKKQKMLLVVRSLFLVASFICYYAAKYLALPIETFLIMISLSYAALYLVLLIMVIINSRDTLAKAA